MISTTLDSLMDEEEEDEKGEGSETTETLKTTTTAGGSDLATNDTGTSSSTRANYVDGAAPASEAKRYQQRRKSEKME